MLGFLTSFLVLRGSDLTRLMVTLGVALVLGEVANAFPRITGGADGLQGVVMGTLLGQFEFDLFGRTAYAYSLTTLFVLFLLARRDRAFAVRPVADGDPPQPAARRSARRAGPFAADRGLHAGRRLCRRGRRAARPDHGLRLARRASSSIARPTCCWC